MTQLYLDCDGVLADFDRAATELLGMPPRAYEKRHGMGAFWRELARHPDFYGSLPLMPDAMELFAAVRHLDPIILTGLPRGNWAAPQKMRWAAEHFPGTRIITCMAVDKRKHARQGDILVDDQLKHAHLWESAGGIFVHHRDAASTIGRLRELIAARGAAHEEWDDWDDRVAAVNGVLAAGGLPEVARAVGSAARGEGDTDLAAQPTVGPTTPPPR